MSPKSIPFSMGLLEIRKSHDNAISVLNIVRVINTKLLTNTVLMLFFFWFAANVDTSE